MLEFQVKKRVGAFALDIEFCTETAVTALFGRSGSGKTSVLNFIAGLRRADAGRIVFEDRTWLDTSRGIDVPANQRRIGYVFQDAMLFPHLTVEANLDFGLKRAPAATHFINRAKVISLLDLGNLLQRKTPQLSGGEKQRVAIGRALLSQPQLLLFDEPLASLDNLRKAEILQYIELLRDEFRLPMIFVSHAVDEVMRIAEQLILIDGGRLRAIGATEDIMGRLDLAPYTGRHEAGAVIHTVVAAHDTQFDLTRLSFAGGELLVPRVGIAVGEALAVRVRARDVSIALAVPHGISINNVLPGVLAEIRAESGPIVDVRIMVGQTTLIARVTRVSISRLQLHVGQPVFALVKAISMDRRSVGYAK